MEGAVHVAGWRRAYTDELRALWRRDPDAFLTLIDLASDGQDVTLVDDFGDEDDAPRRILGAVLKQLARTRRAAARRGQRPAGLGGARPMRAPLSSQYS